MDFGAGDNYLWKNLNTIAIYIVTMVTTIQVSKDLLEKLQIMKTYSKESYEDLIWDLIEDRMELSDETKKSFEQSQREIAEGKTTSWENVKKEFKVNV